MKDNVSRSATPRGARPHLGSSALSVDLDKAFLRTDPLHERLFIAFKARPLVLLPLLAAVLRGRKRFRDRIIDETASAFRLSSCPRQVEVEQLVDSARQQGKPVEWLSREPLRLGVEDAEVQRIFGGSSDSDVLDSATSVDDKVSRLQARFPNGFAYVGNRAADMPLWRAASERYGVNLPNAVKRQAQREGLDIIELAKRRPLIVSLLGSMRPHQWLKNLLVFVPFALSLGHLKSADVGVALLAFACLCLLTSGTYIVNDLFDVEADRRHPRKRDRPIAAGDIQIPVAAVASVVLVGIALGLALLLSPAFALALLAYLGVTLAYSFRLKRVAMVDVLVIAMLFTLRILAGMLLTTDVPSHWLLMFSIFFFLSLAFMKREVEFNVMHRAGRQTLSGRGYAMEDRMYVLSCGLSSGMASIVIFSLFITETLRLGQANYGTPALLWGVMGIVTYWVLRMWLLTTRGLMNDDPILFAARDRTSLLLGAASAVLIVCAQVLHL